MTTTESEEEVILELGAGTDPSPKSTHTLDIRTDIPVDYPGINIAEDRIPLEEHSVDQVVGYHILEHVPPERIGFVFKEIDRVLRPSGEGHFETPHAGTWSAATDPTHQGVGGFTPDIDMYINGKPSSYWPEIKWDVSAYANLEFPTFLRPSLRVGFELREHSREMVKLPFVDGTVIIEIEKNKKSNQ